MYERLKALTFVMMAIAGLYVFDGLNIGRIPGDGVTGLAVSEQALNEQDVSCYDSDNRDYYTQGTTYARLFQANGEIPKADTCEGSSLVEYYCVMDEPQVEFYDCPVDCMNGACKDW